MKPTGLPPLPFPEALREIYGPREFEDFEIHETAEAWVFVYAPLRMVTGKVLKRDAEMAFARMFDKRDIARWVDAAVRKACDISPLRVMQISQVGL